jgi:hypothetical protein
MYCVDVGMEARHVWTVGNRDRTDRRRTNGAGSLVAELGLRQSIVSRTWRAINLQPHRSETFRPSTDPRYVNKVRDMVGLYLSPRERAVVLCIDEKSQVQALDRT